MNILNTQITSPLDQFEIRDLLNIDAPILNNLHISLTNIGLYLSISLILILAISILSTNNNRLVSNN
jgi:F-type H+-transporting ATPase subunit a